MNGINRLDTFVKKFKLIQESDRIVVGCSMGADSRYLVEVISTYAAPDTWRLVYCHHQLRAAADLEIDAIRHLGDQKRVPIEICYLDVRGHARQTGQSIEAAARSLRLSALFDVAKKFMCNKIALGHHMDDNAESIIAKWIRGTGIRFGPILPIHRWDNGIEIIHPLLGLKADEIRSALKQAGIAYVIDESNHDLRFQRNRIRHCIIPEFKKINPKISESLSNFANDYGEISEYMKMRILPVLAQAKRRGNWCQLAKQVLNSVHPVEQKWAITYWIFQCCGSDFSINRNEINFAIESISVTESRYRVLQDDWTLFSDASHLWLGRFWEPPPTYQYCVNIDDTDVKIDEIRSVVQIRTIYQPGWRAVYVSTKGIMIRSEVPGDLTMVSGRLRALKAYWSTHRVSWIVRQFIPLLNPTGLLECPAVVPLIEKPAKRMWGGEGAKEVNRCDQTVFGRVYRAVDGDGAVDRDEAIDRDGPVDGEEQNKVYGGARNKVDGEVDKGIDRKIKIIDRKIKRIDREINGELDRERRDRFGGDNVTGSAAVYDGRRNNGTRLVWISVLVGDAPTNLVSGG